MLLECYQTGALDFERMMAVMHGCALGCTTKARISILGVLAERALAIDKQSIGSARREDYPAPLQRLAAGVVEFLREEGRQPKFEFVLDEAVLRVT